MNLLANGVEGVNSLNFNLVNINLVKICFAHQLIDIILEWPLI